MKLAWDVPYMKLYYQSCSNGSDPMHIWVTGAQTRDLVMKTSKIFLPEIARPIADLVSYLIYRPLPSLL